MKKETLDADVVVVGCGIVGLAIARELRARHPRLAIIAIDKESGLACHASGRNSGVVHAGFYYTPESLKARLTAEGNRLLTEYCLKRSLSILRCGKVVVAKNEAEMTLLHELKRRGDANNVALEIIGEERLATIEPNARTHQEALYSPTTSTINPREVVESIATELREGCRLLLNEAFIRRIDEDCIETTSRIIRFKHFINSAGLYADKVAHSFGVGLDYTLLPFKGLYLAYKDDGLVRAHVYPVPDLKNPFLGVHLTKTVDGHVKVGPTAIPAFWREQYNGLSNFNVSEFVEVLSSEARLFAVDSFNFRKLAFDEMRKYYGGRMKDEAANLLKKLDQGKFSGFLSPGIRAQLLDRRASKLVMDFVVEHGENSTHILNAVSPAFTCAFSFANFVVDKMQNRCIVHS
ncbi:MAG: L-2-hydroxyglutarate oxidase [Deltaproteobacteria bacterium]|nr:L-2-hydroxyglutarate oxidase [Deltaproteobacteria bacterium]